MNIKANISSPVTQAQAAQWPYFILLLCFGACFIRFPGEWDNDTIGQHAQMLSGLYMDWHPPVFAAFWRLLNWLWNGISGMDYMGSGVIYIVHAIALWSGLALLTRAARCFFDSFIGQPRLNFVLLLSFVLFGGLFEMVPMTRFIFKDTAMMAAYILTLGIAMNMPKNIKWRITTVFFCILLLFYGTAVRHNAIFALIPLIFLVLLKAWPQKNKLFIASLGLAIWGGTLWGINFANYSVLNAKREYSLQEIIFVDFWRMNYMSKTFDLPPLPEGNTWSPLSEDIFFRFYNEKGLYINQGFRFIRQYYGSEDSIQVRYDYSKDPAAFEHLKSAWLDKIKRQFKYYVKMHKVIFTKLLREYSFMGFTGAWFWATSLLILFSAGILFIRKKWNKREAAPYLIALSAILYVSPYMVAIPDIQRRYLFWFFFGGFLSIIWLIGDFILKKRSVKITPIKNSPR